MCFITYPCGRDNSRQSTPAHIRGFFFCKSSGDGGHKNQPRQIKQSSLTKQSMSDAQTGLFRDGSGFFSNLDHLKCPTTNDKFLNLEFKILTNDNFEFLKSFHPTLRNLRRILYYSYLLSIEVAAGA